MKILLFSLLAIMSLRLPSYQKHKVEKINPTDLVFRNKEKPSVYIEFVRIGDRPPLKEEESKEGIWLRLHNNTRWDISFCSFDVSKDYGDLGIYYEVEKMPPPRSRLVYFDKKESSDEEPQELAVVPLGYPEGHVCTIFRLQSGKSVVFSIPKEHIAKNLAIKIKFNYGWEDPSERETELEPDHRVYFFGQDVPTKEKTPSKT